MMGQRRSRKRDSRDALQMTHCLRYMPGVVLSLEQFGPTPSKCPIFGLSEAAGFLFSPCAGLVLRAYLVAPGDELRYLAELQQRRGVLATSLDYLGPPAGRKP